MQLWQPGQELDRGKFVVEQLLGFGGFGVTYRVRQNKTGKMFVIKTLKPEFKENPNFRQLQLQFINEVITLASCRHPNIVTVSRKVIEHDDLICMVMEYIKGQTLGKYLQSRGRLSEDEAIAFIDKIGRALEFVHQQGLLHRDIKPDNIMLRQSNKEPVLIDFGLARELIDDLTYQSMSHTGTPFYAPMEEYDSENNYGAWTDVYALAATLYTLVVGKPQALFSHIRKYEFAFNNRDPLIPPKQHLPELSDRINKAILKGLAIEPGDRPQTVQKWLYLLKQSQPPKPEQPVHIDNFSKQDKGKYRESISLKTFEFETVRIKEIKVSPKFLGLGEKKKAILSREQKQARYFIEDLGNSIGLEMVEIPGGSFTMGSPKDELKRSNDESPQHEVTVPSFYMGKHEVTQAQWKQVGALPQIERKLKPNPSYFKGDNLPVEQVSWYDAVEFCKRLSQATGKEYRLPSEAEWEYACRVGTTTPFYFGETTTTELVNYNGDYTYADAPKGKYRRKTTAVGLFPPNAFGLYDMHGNIWEWCADTYQESYVGAPDDGSAWTVDKRTRHILRGGSWLVNPLNCRSAKRIRLAPDVDGNNFGFRCSIASGLL